MKKSLFGIVLLAAIAFLHYGAWAEEEIVEESAPPPCLSFSAPPSVIVLPDAPDVYVVPDVQFDLFFWNGWWWRPWNNRWYRSRYCDRGWSYYNGDPRFYGHVDPRWRECYLNHNWRGYAWNHHYIPYGQLQKHWRSWQENRYWERSRSWNVQGYNPRSPTRGKDDVRHHRQEQYREKPSGDRILPQYGTYPSPHSSPSREQYNELPQGRHFEPRGERGTLHQHSPGRHGSGDYRRP